MLDAAALGAAVLGGATVLAAAGAGAAATATAGVGAGALVVATLPAAAAGAGAGGAVDATAGATTAVVSALLAAPAAVSVAVATPAAAPTAAPSATALGADVVDEDAAAAAGGGGAGDGAATTVAVFAGGRSRRLARCTNGRNGWRRRARTALRVVVDAVLELHVGGRYRSTGVAQSRARPARRLAGRSRRDRLAARCARNPSPSGRAPARA